MTFPRAVLVTTGFLLAHQAQAASFVVLGGEPVVRPRSVLVLGEPAAPRPAATARAVPPPDRSIETAALRPTHPATAEAAADVVPSAAAPDMPATVEPDPRSVVAWPPVLSRSMVAFGVPLPDETQVVALAPRAPFSLPAVFRAGLAGEAFQFAPTPARAAVQEAPAEKKAAKPERPATGRSMEADEDEMAEGRDPAPLKPQDRTPAPAAPPSVPATPPPTMRLE
ncbi:hypothetical protein [Aquibium microcysteis]|uniref:hypothetical protein n=1 Tax=Aquibium microcysteis TaxID=675281 RepID=UPI00165D1F6C|nr:hypothetical protein [Aquibium microcysteis]